MSFSEYIKIKKEELISITLIVLVLSFLFSLSFQRFTSSTLSFTEILISFFIFLFLVFTSRLLIMKIVAYRNAFDLELETTYFDRFWIRPWDTLSYHVGGKVPSSYSFTSNIFSKISNKKSNQFKGIPTVFVSLLIYILTLGVVVYSNLWKFSIKTIPHLFIGSKQRFEMFNPFVTNIDVSKFRFTKVLFWGFMFYGLIFLFLKAFLEQSTLYGWYIGILTWIVFFSLIPFPGTEGFELWSYFNLAWFCVLTILFLEIIALFIFESLLVLTLVLGFSALLLLFVVFYKKVLKE